MSNEDKSIQKIAEEFEQMVKNQAFAFFDEETLEDLTDYYINLQQYRKALEVTALARKQYPYSPLFIVIKAQVHIQMGENLIALEVLNEAERIEPYYSEIHMTRGSIYSQMGLHEKSISAFEKAKDYDAPSDEVAFCVGYELINLEKFEEAIPQFKHCLEINPEHDLALNELAYCYEVTGDQEDGVNFFSAFTDRKPYNQYAWFNLGVAYTRNGLFEKAIESYDYALAINAEFVPALINKASTFFMLGDTDDAIGAFTEVLAIDPQRADAHYYIGECYERKNDWDTALIYYHKATRLDPDYADAWLGIGVALEAQGRVSEGIHYVKKALDMNGENHEYWYTYGDFQHRLGFHEEAENAYRHVSQLMPENPSIWLDLSKVQFEMELTDKAIGTLTEGLKNHPHNAELMYRMAAYLLHTGRKQDALEYLHSALHQDFEKHEEMFEEFPQLRDNGTLLELIESYRK
ncbi:MAG: hypothetical protein RL007_1282 [Bacteroidota bacterium]|jgi:tetratricopeptide (TPR) repeat protein